MLGGKQRGDRDWRGQGQKQRDQWDAIVIVWGSDEVAWSRVEALEVGRGG